MESTCFWALLSVKDLEFIHTSTLNKLKGVSLFDLFHPNEVLLAKRDLYKFIDSNLLGGSVTRCRLKDSFTLHHNNTTTGYVIVDIIMYVATKDLVLTFFHRPQSSFSNTCCIEEGANTTSNKLDEHKLKSTLLSIVSCNNSNADIKSSPRQFIHILDNRTKSVLLSWPDHYPNEMKDGAQMDYYLDDRPMSPTKVSSCFQCVQNPIRFNSLGQRVSSIQIQYGNIKFILVQEQQQQVNKLTLSLPSSPMYNYSNHYHHNNKQKAMIDPLLLQVEKRHISPPILRQKLPPRKEQERHSFPFTATESSFDYHPYSAPSSPIVRNRSSSAAIKLENLLSPVIHNNNNSNKYHHPYHHRNQCQSCGTNSSPEWRRGPTGHKTLCNACGLRYSRSVARQGKMINQQKLLLSQRRSISPQSPLSSCSSTYSYPQHQTTMSPQQQQNHYNRTYYSVL